MASPSHGFAFFANHLNDPIVDSLDAGTKRPLIGVAIRSLYIILTLFSSCFSLGYRGLALDLCNCNGEMVFCHGGSGTGCGVGSRDPVETFQLINEWIDDNPNNVVMIWLQINEEAGGSISLTDVNDVVRSVPAGSTSGLTFADRLYLRDRYEDDEWPTLQKLIDAQQQVLFFYQGGPGGSEEPPPGIHYFYEYGFSTPWSYASVSELENSYASGCPIDRGSTNRNDFFLMNAFVTEKFFGFQVQPSQRSAEQINTASFLNPLVERCQDSIGQTTNIVSVDFWDSGDMASFVKAHNSNLVSSDDTTDSETSTPSQTESNKAPSTGMNRIGGRRGIAHIRDSYFGG
jgi:hypothetical protein